MDNMTEEEKSLTEKRRYILVYNPEREKLDITYLENKIEVVKNILSKKLGKKKQKKNWRA